MVHDCILDCLCACNCIYSNYCSLCTSFYQPTQVSNGNKGDHEQTPSDDGPTVTPPVTDDSTPVAPSTNDGTTKPPKVTDGNGNVKAPITDNKEGEGVKIDPSE